MRTSAFGLSYLLFLGACFISGGVTMRMIGSSPSSYLSTTDGVGETLRERISSSAILSAIFFSR